MRSFLSYFFPIIIVLTSTSICSADILDFNSGGLSFTINNNDPFNATIDFDSVSLGVPTTSIGFSKSFNAPTPEISVLNVFTPLPNPAPFPSPPRTSTNTRTTTSYSDILVEINAEFMGVNDLITFGGNGPTPLTTNNFNSAVFDEQPNIGDSVFATLSVKGTAIRTTQRTTRFLENSVEIDVIVEAPEIEAIDIMFNDLIELELVFNSAQSPNSLNSINFPDSVGLNSGLGGTYQNISPFPELGIDFAVLSEINLSSIDGTSFIVTTVPIPAAFWLFGSAVLGFFGVSRSRISK